MKLFADVAVQRYTPPTCTLELRTKRSRLGGKNSAVPEETRFSLNFDDPRLPEDKQIGMEGDQGQLDRLCEVVNNYVQTFLEQTFRQGLDRLGSSDYHSSQETILFAPSDSLSLTPKGLLTHTFCFGLLESVSLPNPMMELSTSQLFDLANALETYGQQVLAQKNTQPPEKTFWVWIRTALISLAAIALTGIGLKVFQTSNQTVESLAPALPIKTKFNLTDVLPPVPPAPSGKPVPNPNLAPALALRDPLPAPNTIQADAPPSRNQTVNLAVPPLRVLPPNPVVPPAPPAVAIAPPKNSGGNSMMVIPTPANQAILPLSNPSTAGLTVPTLPPQPGIPPLNSLSGQRLNSQSIPSNTAIAAFNASSNPNQYNLLDTIPQVAEARQYFQERWQPPDDLTQTLEYQLLIKPDGSLEQCIPLGKAASLYLAKLPLPSQGQPFLSPLGTQEEQTLRLVLSPNGSVKTLLE